MSFAFAPTASDLDPSELLHFEAARATDPALRRRIAAHAVLAASCVLVLPWALVLGWLALACGLAWMSPRAARRALGDAAAGPSAQAFAAAAALGLHLSPALLALVAIVLGGAWGALIGGFTIAGLAVHTLGSGDWRGLRALFAATVRTFAMAARSPSARPAAAPSGTAEPRRTAPASADSGRMMRALLADLLDLSRLEQGALRVETIPFDLRRLVAEAARDWRSEARRKGLQFTICGGRLAPRWVSGDPVRIRQILDTMLGDAVKFTREGAVSLNIGAAPAPDGRMRLTLSVMDNGPGMTAEQFAALFEAYDSKAAGPRRPGPGLSRSLARELARLMGGELSASSAPGLGAIFSLELPLALAETGAARIDTTRGIRVLVVDDHAVYRQAFSLILDSVCKEVVCAEDGVQALDLLAAQPFDLVLMDLSMPRLGGLAATRRLRSSSSRGRDVAVIALTASAGDEDRAACLAAGMNGFVSKPVDARELLAAVHAVLSGEEISQAA